LKGRLKSKILRRPLFFVELVHVTVKNVKAFEETFLLQMEAKLPEVLATFKTGALPRRQHRQDGGTAKELILKFKK